MAFQADAAEPPGKLRHGLQSTARSAARTFPASLVMERKMLRGIKQPLAAEAKEETGG